MNPNANTLPKSNQPVNIGSGNIRPMSEYEDADNLLANYLSELQDGLAALRARLAPVLNEGKASQAASGACNEVNQPTQSPLIQTIHVRAQSVRFALEEIRRLDSQLDL